MQNKMREVLEEQRILAESRLEQSLQNVIFFNSFYFFYQFLTRHTCMTRVSQ